MNRIPWALKPFVSPPAWPWAVRPCKLLVKEASETPRVTQVITMSLGYPPQLDVKALLQKAPHIVVAGYRETNLKLSRKRTYSLLAFIVLQGVTEALGEEKHKWSHSALDP